MSLIRVKSTDGEGPLSIGLMAEDIVRLMDYLKIDKAKIVGWDAGAIIGLELARQRPERVKALVAYVAWTNPNDLKPQVLEWLRTATLANLKADMSYDYARLSPPPTTCRSCSRRHGSWS